MTGPGRIPRGRAALLAAFLVVFAIFPSGCLAPDSDENSYLRFQNPELTTGLDSLQVLGVNARKGDTLAIRRWRKGEDFPSQAAYPPGLEAAFTLLVRGYIGDALVYQSRTAIAAGKAQPQVRDFLLAAPALPDLPITRAARVGDAVEL